MDRDRVRELTKTEAALFAERTPASRELAERARRSLAGGVTSSLHSRDPYPVYLARGGGAHVWDVDGNEYVDFHNGFSAMIQGHAHPAIVAAIEERVAMGTHFGATTEDSIAVAEELTRRFGLTGWRFTNSGTESNMAAIRIARAATGRDAIVRMERSYHGHAEFDHVHEVAFNDAGALEGCLTSVRPACVLMEAAMTSTGLVPPEPGYLETVRELTRRNGVLLVLDEVKTGLTIAPGGASRRFRVEPDIVTLAKSLGAGLPSGAIGMTEPLARLVEDGRVPVYGTYNGHPLAMAAARAGLLEVLTPAAYGRFERLSERFPSGAVALGAKGCIPGSADDPELAELYWLWGMNRGILMTRGRGIEWTLSVAHTEADVDSYLTTFAELSP
jgi:glutamate-1-semialdehyde 2,1-aminomutase